MILVLTLISSLLVLKLTRNFLLKHENIAYVIFTTTGIIYLIPFVFDFKLLVDNKLNILFLIFCGNLSFALFIIVMFLGVIKNKTFKKNFYPLRRQISILACIVSYTQNIYYGRTYFYKLFTFKTLGFYTFTATIISLVMIVLMTILFITSFKNIKNKMNKKTWKNLHKSSYVFYFLLFTHVILLNLNKVRFDKFVLVNVIIYLLIFTTYFILKIKDIKKPFSYILIVLTLLIFIFLSIICFNKNIKYGKKCNAFLEKEVVVEKEKVIEKKNTFKIYKDGKYTSKAMGYNNWIKVEVEIKDDKIKKVKILKIEDDEEYYELDLSWFIKQIINKTNEDVDNISGATTTADAIKKAVSNALSQALLT